MQRWKTKNKPCKKISIPDWHSNIWLHKIIRLNAHYANITALNARKRAKKRKRIAKECHNKYEGQPILSTQWRKSKGFNQIKPNSTKWAHRS